jgi:hypothetical protein
MRKAAGAGMGLSLTVVLIVAAAAGVYIGQQILKKPPVCTGSNCVPCVTNCNPCTTSCPLGSILSFTNWLTTNSAPGGCCTENVLSNGTLQIIESNSGGGSNSYGYDTAQRGNFPWSPCSSGVPPVGVLPTMSSFSVQFKFLSSSGIGSGSRYHIDIAPYFYLPNAPGGFRYNCLDTQVRAQNVGGVNTQPPETETYDPGDSYGWDQVTVSAVPGGIYTLTANLSTQCASDFAAWNLQPTTCVLMGIEIGTEGYSFGQIAVNFYGFSYT